MVSYYLTQLCTAHLAPVGLAYVLSVSEFWMEFADLNWTMGYQDIIPSCDSISNSPVTNRMLWFRIFHSFLNILIQGLDDNLMWIIHVITCLGIRTISITPLPHYHIKQVTDGTLMYHHSKTMNTDSSVMYISACIYMILWNRHFQTHFRHESIIYHFCYVIRQKYRQYNALICRLEKNVDDISAT